MSHGAYLNSYIYRGLTLDGNRGSAVLLHASSHEAGNLQFLGWPATEGNEFWLDAGIQPGSRIAVRDKVHGSIVLRRADQAGTLKAAWNARVQ